MKHFFILITSVLMCLSLEAQVRSFRNLIGTWEAIDSENEAGVLQVVDSNTIILIYGTQKMYVVDHKTDFSKSPAWFDFKLKDDATTIDMHSLIEFINDDTIKWQVFKGGGRTASFTGAGESVIMKRKK